MTINKNGFHPNYFKYPDHGFVNCFGRKVPVSLMRLGQVVRGMQQELEDRMWYRPSSMTWLLTNVEEYIEKQLEHDVLWNDWDYKKSLTNILNSLHWRVSNCEEEIFDLEQDILQLEYWIEQNEIDEEEGVRRIDDKRRDVDNLEARVDLLNLELKILKNNHECCFYNTAIQEKIKKHTEYIGLMKKRLEKRICLSLEEVLDCE